MPLKIHYAVFICTGTGCGKNHDFRSRSGGEYGRPELLTFQINYLPVEDMQGVLYANALDNAGSEPLQKHYQDVFLELQASGEAAGLDV